MRSSEHNFVLRYTMYSFYRAIVRHCRADRVESKWKDFGSIEQMGLFTSKDQKFDKSENVAVVIRDDSCTGFVRKCDREL
jgi:hypothetical protein